MLYRDWPLDVMRNDWHNALIGLVLFRVRLTSLWYPRPTEFQNMHLHLVF